MSRLRLFQKPLTTCLCGRVTVLESWPESHNIPVRRIVCGYCGWEITREQHAAIMESRKKKEDEKANATNDSQGT